MAQLTKHSIQRLKDRYGFDHVDAQKVGAKAGDVNSYTLIRLSSKREGEIREVSYKGHLIHCIIKQNKVVTVVYPVYEQDESAYDVQELRMIKTMPTPKKEEEKKVIEIRKNKIEEKIDARKIDRKDYMMSAPLFVAIAMLISRRWMARRASV